jgi:hypothetical protein
MIFDTLFIVTVTVFVLGLVLQGYLAPGIGLAAAIALVAVRALARRMRVRVARLAFALGLPAAGLIVLVGLHGGDTAAGRSALIKAVLAMMLILFAFHYMLSGGAGRRNRRKDGL